jgi:hypothetical protein
MKKSTRKEFVLNVIVAYYEPTNPNNYREPIHNIFKFLAWLHALDYSIDLSTQIFDKAQPTTNGITDIVYLRSGKNTLLSLREFQKVLDSVFSKSIATFFYGVDVFYQNQAATKLYPFPSEFYRPLNYPYVEIHKGLQKEMLVHKEALGIDIDLVPNPN